MTAGFLSRGFRPFFLSAALWALVAMALWLLMFTGRLELPSALDPVSWHAHEALFGYLGAVLAGFLLTALPNWTGQSPITGWPLASLLALWAIGRMAIAMSAWLSPLEVALLDLSFFIVLGGLALREIIAGRNWRNLLVVVMIGVLASGNALFHRESAEGVSAASGYGLRIGLAAAIMLISVIGGRIVPTFTRNWLASRGHTGLPAPFGRLDGLALALTMLALTAWIAFPEAQETGYLLVVSGFAQAARLARWRGRDTTSEPLVWVLHVAYAFVPLGMLCVGAATLWPGAMTATSAQHLWMAGAVGVMTLAVMTRATLGHSGRALTAGVGTAALYLMIVISVLARLAGGMLPQHAMALWTLAGLLWCCSFVGFLLLYGRLLIGATPK
ncbi:MAG: NnrS family protein [Rhodospirillaceae bacterium]|nr:NnrS family protein [Rhodospirillaceae bacterium]